MEDLIHPILTMFINYELPLWENYYKWLLFLAIIFIQFTLYPINELFKRQIVANKMVGADYSVIGIPHNAPFIE